MSIFKKYLKLILESNYSNADDDPREIANLNKNELLQLQSNSNSLVSHNVSNMKLDKDGKKFIENIVKYVKDEIIDYPKLTVINITSKFTLPNVNGKKHKFVSPVGNPKRLGEDFIKNEQDVVDYKDLLINELVKSLNEMIVKEELGEYLEGTKINEIKIVDANEGNSNALNYPWYSIDIDIEGIKQRDWKQTRKWSMKHDRPKPTREQIDKWFRASNAAKHASVRAENERHKKRIDDIRKSNEKNSYSLNMNKKANRDKVKGK